MGSSTHKYDWCHLFTSRGAQGNFDPDYLLNKCDSNKKQ